MTRIAQITLLVISAGLARAAEPVPASPDTKEMHDPRQRLVAWYPIGWTDNNPATRNIGMNLTQSGWPIFVKHHILPQVQWGIRRILIHNPFGCLADENMQFSQYEQARKLGLAALTDRDAFVRAWRPITEQGVEVIAYLGSPSDKDREYGPLMQKNDDEGRRKLEDLCLEPLLAAGMSIALDAASAENEKSPTYLLAKRLRDQHVRVYIEALSSAGSKYWHDYPAMCTTWFWWNPDRPRWNVTETAGGTMILLDASGATTWAEWDKVITGYHNLMAQGRSIAVGGDDLAKLARARVPIERLLPEK